MIYLQITVTILLVMLVGSAGCYEKRMGLVEFLIGWLGCTALFSTVICGIHFVWSL